MTDEQEIVEVDREELFRRSRELAREGWRLVQISCTEDEGFRIDYSLDRDYRLLNLRLRLAAENPRIASITGIFACALAYEREIRDLFGIAVEGLDADGARRMYRIEAKAPFRSTDGETSLPRKNRESTD
jgi:Ni,Fe-hydrogenase III component G